MASDTLPTVGRQPSNLGDPRSYPANEIVTADHAIWDSVHPDLRAQKDSILGYSGSADKGRYGKTGATGNIAAGALVAADAVFRQAAREGVKMKVAIGGGSNRHSANHGNVRSHIGESIDIKPVSGWGNRAQRERFAKIAAGAGANRLGVSYSGNGLHVQVSNAEGLTGRPTTAWKYGGRPFQHSAIKSALRDGSLYEQNRRRIGDLFGRPEYDPLTSIGRPAPPFRFDGAPLGRVTSRDLPPPAGATTAPPRARPNTAGGLLGGDVLPRNYGAAFPDMRARQSQARVAGRVAQIPVGLGVGRPNPGAAYDRFNRDYPQADVSPALSAAATRRAALETARTMATENASYAPQPRLSGATAGRLASASATGRLPAPSPALRGTATAGARPRGSSSAALSDPASRIASAFAVAAQGAPPAAIKAAAVKVASAVRSGTAKASTGAAARPRTASLPAPKPALTGSASARASATASATGNLPRPAASRPAPQASVGRKDYPVLRPDIGTPQERLQAFTGPDPIRVATTPVRTAPQLTARPTSAKFGAQSSQAFGASPELVARPARPAPSRPAATIQQASLARTPRPRPAAAAARQNPVSSRPARLPQARPTLRGANPRPEPTAAQLPTRLPSARPAQPQDTARLPRARPPADVATTSTYDPPRRVTTTSVPAASRPPPANAIPQGAFQARPNPAAAAGRIAGAFGDPAIAAGPRNPSITLATQLGASSLAAPRRAAAPAYDPLSSIRAPAAAPAPRAAISPATTFAQRVAMSTQPPAAPPRAAAPLPTFTGNLPRARPQSALPTVAPAPPRPMARPAPIGQPLDLLPRAAQPLVPQLRAALSNVLPAVGAAIRNGVLSAPEALGAVRAGFAPRSNTGFGDSVQRGGFATERGTSVGGGAFFEGAGDYRYGNGRSIDISGVGSRMGAAEMKAMADAGRRSAGGGTRRI